MGFGSFKKSFKKATGASFSLSTLGRTSLALGTFGASELAFAGLGIDPEDITGAKEAAKKQAAALRAAGRIEEAQKLELALFRQGVKEQFAPFRERGGAELERLGAQQPGETEFFKSGLEKGTTAIAQQAAGFGLADSGATQVAFGELGANLLTQEELNRQRGLQSAAALSQAGLGFELGSLQQEGALASRLAQTQANIGAIEAQGDLANRQFFLGLGTQALGIGAGALLGGPFGAAAGGAAAQQASTTTAPSRFDLQSSILPGTPGQKLFQEPQFMLGG